MMPGNNLLLEPSFWQRLNEAWQRKETEPTVDVPPEPKKERPCYTCARAESFLTLECGVDVCATCVCRYIRSDE